MIQLHRLEGFYWVARTGGYARAARAFPYPITQPAVHQQVKKLEGELGVALFERLGKEQLRLTPAGRILLDFAGPFFTGLPAAVRAARAGDHPGELVVWSEPLLLRRLMPPWLRRLQQRRPGVQVALQEMQTTDTGPLRRGEADLMVGYLPDPPGDVATQEVARLRGFLVLPAAHPRAGSAGVTPADLRDEPFVAYHRGMRGHDLQMEALRHWAVRPPQLLYATTADAILGFVASGLGYSLVPALVPETPRDEGIAAVPLQRPRVEFPVVAAWRRDAPEHGALDAALATAPRPPRSR